MSFLSTSLDIWSEMLKMGSIWQAYFDMEITEKDKEVGYTLRLINKEKNK